MQIEWPVLHIEWRILGGAALLVILSHVLLIRRRIVTGRRLATLEGLQLQAEGELLRCRAEYARQLEDVKTEHARAASALQKNVNDLSALHKEKAQPSWSQPKVPNVSTLTPRPVKPFSS